jgi:L,D-transpeptidase catalytic domain
VDVKTPLITRRHFMGATAALAGGFAFPGSAQVIRADGETIVADPLGPAPGLPGASSIGSDASPLANLPIPPQLSDGQLKEIAQRELARAGRKVWLRDVVGIADFAQPSFNKRFYLVDLVSGTVRSYYCSHGIGSDPQHDGWLKTFSNVPNSLATSRGAYVTHTWYEGQNGTSMRLTGMEADNSHAEDRAIVVHGSWYANPAMIDEWGKLGRSSGCFVVPEGNLLEVLARLGPGRLLFADKISVA